MPKIRIKERDLTTNPLVGVNEQYILYVLPTGLTQQTGEEGALINELITPREISLDEARLIDACLDKNFEGTKTKFLEEAISLGGHIIVANSWNYAKQYCGDRNQYDIKFILASETSETTEAEEGEPETTYHHDELKSALEIAQARKDCVVVYGKLQTKYGEEEKTVLEASCSYIGTSTDIPSSDKGFYSDERKTPVGKYVVPVYSTGIHRIGDLTTILKANEAYVLAFLNSLNTGYASWQAVAGATRGAIPGDYTVDGFLKESEIDDMQPRLYAADRSIAINPIVNMNPWGMRIWGNRTCLPNTSVKDAEGEPSEASDQLVASSFANVRILICDIKKALYRAARSCQFEQNSDVLWVNFTSQVNTLLERMKQGYGIAAYKWMREESTERAKLKATLKVVPLEAVEDFDLSIELADSLEVAE